MNSRATEPLANCTFESLSRYFRERGRERVCEHPAFTRTLSPSLSQKYWERE
jgi:hypothetical protein